MERVGIYNRCSTEEESQIGALLVQAQESREIAAAQGWMIVEQYVESQSGTTAEGRREYQRMLRDIECGSFDIIMIKSIDRLARNAKDWYLFLDCIARNKTRLYLYLDRMFYKSDDALVTGIKAILAEQFSKELSQKIKNAHRRRQSLKTGLNITRDMFGWDKISKDIYVVNEAEAEFFRMACLLAEQGLGYRRIAGEMYERGARQKSGKRISELQWQKMLRSPRAYGTVILHRTEYDFETKRRVELPKEQWIYVEDALPPLITKEYYQHLIKILDARSGNAPRVKKEKTGKGKYPFSNKLICAECGSKYYRTVVSYSWGRQIQWQCSKYMTAGSKGGSGCNNIRLIEEELFGTLEGELSSKTEQEELANRFMELFQRMLKANRREREEATCLMRRERLEKQRYQLLEKLLEGVIADREYQSFCKRLDEEEQQIKEQLSGIKQEQEQYNNSEERMASLRELLISGGLLARARVLEVLGGETQIRIHKNGELELYRAEEKDGREEKLRIRYAPVSRSSQRKQQQMQQLCDCIERNPYIRVCDIMDTLGMKESTVYSRLRELREQGILEQRGSREDGLWLVHRKESNKEVEK